ncbi:uncharacterized protein LOC141710128 [Apium graveolens]|uniref:uncharacterized protein LOC141710128 n=1 Tax=Apium graveolens TaxID=4045 RepID=UPI003D7AD7B8
MPNSCSDVGEAGLQGNITILPSDNVFDVFCRVFATCNREQCTLITLMCWSIWRRRNIWVWEKINQYVFGIKAAALNMLTEWRKAHDQQLNSGNNTGTPLAIRKWEKPQVSWVKINIDDALFEDIDCIGLGSVVRGSNGQFIMARSSRQDVLIPPREAEAMCLKESLVWLKDKGLQKCVFETDSQVLARACKGGRGRSLFHTIVKDCVDLIQRKICE